MKILQTKYLTIEILPAIGFAIGISYYGELELCKKEFSFILFCIGFNVHWGK